MATLLDETARQRIVLDAAGRRSFATFPFTVKRAVLLTDLTDESDIAADYAISLASYFDARVTLLHVCSPSRNTELFHRMRTHTELFPGLLAIGGNNEWRSTADLDLLRLQAEIQHRGVRCDACLRCGRYAQEAFKVAANRSADLLVISEHHLSWFRSFTQEDHEGTFLIDAPCPLVVVADEPAIAPCPGLPKDE